MIITKVNAFLQKVLRFYNIIFKIILKFIAIARKNSEKKNIEVFILYNSFIFNFI